MRKEFEELDYRQTEMGELILRRRWMRTLETEVFEVKLGGAFLMSSLFHEVEVALADLALAELPAASWDVVVGGLGLGYTAAAALAHPALRSLLVVDALAPVIEWHQRGLVPLGPVLARDPRCRFLHADFFALAASPQGFVPSSQGRPFHAILLDIDHSPRLHLHARHASFYQPQPLRALASHLHPGGVFAMWSDEPPDPAFISTLQAAFPDVRAREISFPNATTGGSSASTIYLARRA